jgi:hypothetical protein
MSVGGAFLQLGGLLMIFIMRSAAITGRHIFDNSLSQATLLGRKSLGRIIS